MRLTDFIPPILTGILKKVLRSPRTYRAFPSYEAAQATLTGGYEDDSVIDVIARKTKRFIQEQTSDDLRKTVSAQIAQNIAAFLLVKNEMKKNDDMMRVVEIGGACGATYTELHTHLPTLCTAWSVVETKNMVRKAKECGFESHDLRFYSELREAFQQTEPTMLFMQAVLQYVPSPLKYFEDILSHAIPWIYLTRNVFHPNTRKETVILHSKSLSSHGPGTLSEPIPTTPITVPLMIVPLLPLKQLITSHGYELAYTFEETYSHTFVIDGVTHITKSEGLLLRKKL